MHCPQRTHLRAPTRTALAITQPTHSRAAQRTHRISPPPTASSPLCRLCDVSPANGDTPRPQYGLRPPDPPSSRQTHHVPIAASGLMHPPPLPGAPPPGHRARPALPATPLRSHRRSASPFAPAPARATRRARLRRLPSPNAVRSSPRKSRRPGPAHRSTRAPRQWPRQRARSPEAALSRPLRTHRPSRARQCFAPRVRAAARVSLCMVLPQGEETMQSEPLAARLMGSETNTPHTPGHPGTSNKTATTP